MVVVVVVVLMEGGGGTVTDKYLYNSLDIDCRFSVSLNILGFN